MTDDKSVRLDAASTREAVSEAYGRAIRQGSGCCPGGCAPAGEGLTARIGYAPEELRALPLDAPPTSFGCGNPLAFSQVQPGQIVLDLGSGAGLDLLVAAQRVGPAGRVIGVDMTGDMILMARANIAAAGMDHVEVRQGIIEALPVEDESVDWVISNCVINLSPEKERVFREIARVLKPGGRMQVSDIVVGDLPDWLRQNWDLYVGCVAGAIDEADYLAGLEAAGLIEVAVLERQIFDRHALLALARGAGMIPADMAAETALELAAGLEGLVASAKIAARKPA